MKVIKIDEITDKNITFLCNKVGCTKKSFVKIVMGYLTNKQLGDIWNRKIHNMAEVRDYDGKFDKVGGEIIGVRKVDEDYPEDVPFEEQICKECGQENIYCECENEIDWDEDDEVEDSPKS